MDPLRSGAIFRVPDTSILRQSPAPRVFRPAESAASSLIRPLAMKPPLQSDVPFSVTSVPFMSPEAVSNRVESIFRQSPMPRALTSHPLPPPSPIDPTRLGTPNAEHTAPSIDKASLSRSPLVPGSSASLLLLGKSSLSVAASDIVKNEPSIKDVPLAVNASPMKEKEVGANFGVHGESTLHTPVKSLQHNNITSSPRLPSSSEGFKTPELLPKNKSASEVPLTDWILKRDPSNPRAILVEGQAPGERTRWQSTAVETRLSARRVRSSSGTVYRLVGNPNEALMRKHFPAPLLIVLREGLPQEWQECFDAALAMSQQSVESNHPTSDSDAIVTIQERPRARRAPNAAKQQPQASEKQQQQEKAQRQSMKLQHDDEEEENEATSLHGDGNVSSGVPVAPGSDSEGDDEDKGREEEKKRRKGRKKHNEESEEQLEVVKVDEEEEQQEEEEEEMRERPKLRERKKQAAKMKESAAKSRTRAKPAPPTTTLRTPSSGVIKSPNLPVSRSGRHLTPPLAFWRNEMPRYDEQRNLKAIEFVELTRDAAKKKRPSPEQKATRKKPAKEDIPTIPDDATPTKEEKKPAKKTKKFEKKKNKEKEEAQSKIAATTAVLLGRRKRRLLDDDGEDDDWTPAQVERLYKALSSVDLPTTDSLYWARIGAAVGRSADECFERFHRAHPTPAKKDKAKGNSPIRLDHGAKTNIQRKNIRKALDRAQERHADDLFDQTPLKAQTDAMLFSPSIAATPDNFPVKGVLGAVEFEATGETPEADLLRPADHDAADAYINKMLKNKRTGGAVAAMLQQESKDDSFEEISPAKANESILSEAPLEGAEDEDYYFST